MFWQTHVSATDVLQVREKRNVLLGSSSYCFRCFSMRVDVCVSMWRALFCSGWKPGRAWTERSKSLRCWAAAPHAGSTAWPSLASNLTNTSRGRYGYSNTPLKRHSLWYLESRRSRQVPLPEGYDGNLRAAWISRRNQTPQTRPLKLNQLGCQSRIFFVCFFKSNSGYLGKDLVCG